LGGVKVSLDLQPADVQFKDLAEFFTVIFLALLPKTHGSPGYCSGFR
jgi:hypothetical protein